MYRTLPLCLLSISCGTPCSDADGNDTCTGFAVVDLSTDPPTFTLDGAANTPPDSVAVGRWIDGSPCEGGSTETAWEVDRLPAGPITYGVIPEGARELTPPEPLVEGLTYSVQFWVYDSLFRKTATSSEDWEGVFVWGDPESATVARELCGE